MRARRRWCVDGNLDNASVALICIPHCPPRHAQQMPHEAIRMEHPALVLLAAESDEGGADVAMLIKRCCLWAELLLHGLQLEPKHLGLLQALPHYDVPV